jgi:DNA-binding CsgD family transcriptional regulator
MTTRTVEESLTLDPAVWRASSEIAEAATSDSASPAEMYQRIVGALDGLVGFDIGAIQAAVPGEPWATAAEKGDTSVVRRNYWRYALETTFEELQRMCNRFALDVDTFETRRLDRLSIYHEFVRPNRQAQAVVRYWTMDGRVWLMGILRGRPSFADKAQARLELVFPHLRAALRAVTARANDERVDDAARDLGAAWSLTRAQERITSYVVRGLTNRETAGLLGMSPNTVRNTLAEVFKKVGVSRRSELAFFVTSGASAGALKASQRDLLQQRQVMTTIASAGRQSGGRGP